MALFLLFPSTLFFSLFPLFFLFFFFLFSFFLFFLFSREALVVPPFFSLIFFLLSFPLSRLTQDIGAGFQEISSYTYGDAEQDQSGWGFLGFGTVNVLQERTGERVFIFIYLFYFILFYFILFISFFKIILFIFFLSFFLY